VPFAWTCSDATSGIDDTFGGGCPSTLSGTITAQGTTNFTDQVKDQAGNLSSSVDRDLNLDNVAPSTSVTGFHAGEIFTTGNPLPGVGCTTPSDATSGVASSSGPTKTADTRNVNGVGDVTYECSATDNAGNSSTDSRTFTVQYGGLSGILQPINPDNTSLFKRGQAVPVKFRLAGDEYVGFSTSGWTIQKQNVACQAFDGVDAVLEDVTSNTPTALFRYDPSADQYIFNADMKNLAVGSCWNFKVRLDNGQTLYSAVFKLAK
jgi:hypothetical protein